jgi:DNA polymerase-3 subunit delta
MKPAAFRKQIARGEIPAVSLLYGDEPLLIEEAVALMRRNFVGRSEEPVNEEAYEGGEVNAALLLQSAQTQSLFGGRKLIVVKRVHQMDASRQDLLLDYLANPSPETCLVFTGEKVDLRRKFYARLQKKWPAVRFYHPYDMRETVSWIRDFLQERGCGIDAEAARLLYEAHGRELQMLRNELEKLTLYKGKDGPIGAADVAHVSGQSREFNPFEFADAVGERDAARALLILKRMQEEGVPLLLILSVVTALFRKLWVGRSLMRRGVDSREILSALKMTYRGEDFLRKLGRFREAELETIYRQFVQIDEAAKTSGPQPEQLLETLVHRICRPGMLGQDDPRHPRQAC